VNNIVQRAQRETQHMSCLCNLHPLTSLHEQRSLHHTCKLFEFTRVGYLPTPV